MSQPFGSPAEYSHHVLRFDPLNANLYHFAAGRPALVASCARSRFDAVRVVVAKEFNERLKKAQQPTGRWGKEETAIERILGRELALLMLAVGHELAQAQCPTRAAAYWLAMRPEERWWILQQTQSAEAGRGWDAALATIFYNMPTPPLPIEKETKP